jgi:hypothetical protein
VQRSLDDVQVELDFFFTLQLKLSKASTPIFLFFLQSHGMPFTEIRVKDLNQCLKLLRTTPNTCGDVGPPMVLGVSTEGITVSVLDAVGTLEDTLQQSHDTLSVTLLQHTVLPIINELPDGRSFALTIASILGGALFSGGSCPHNMAVGDEGTQRANRLSWYQCLDQIQSVARSSWITLLGGCLPIGTSHGRAVDEVLRTRVAPSVQQPLREVVVAYLDSVSGTSVRPQAEILCCVPGMEVAASRLVNEGAFVLECRKLGQPQGPHVALFLAETADSDEHEPLSSHEVQKLATSCRALGVVIVYTDTLIDERAGEAYGLQIFRVTSIQELRGMLPIVDAAHLVITKDHAVKIENLTVLSSRVCLLQVQNAGAAYTKSKMLIGCPATRVSEVWSERRQAVLSALRVCQQSTHIVSRYVTFTSLLMHLQRLPEIQAKDATFVVDLLLCYATGVSSARGEFEGDSVVIEAFCAALRILMTLLQIDGIVV